MCGHVPMDVPRTCHGASQLELEIMPLWWWPRSADKRGWPHSAFASLGVVHARPCRLWSRQSQPMYAVCVKKRLAALILIAQSMFQTAESTSAGTAGHLLTSIVSQHGRNVAGRHAALLPPSHADRDSESGCYNCESDPDPGPADHGSEIQSQVIHTYPKIILAYPSDISHTISIVVQ